MDKTSADAHNVGESHTETQAPICDLLLPIPAKGQETTRNEVKPATHPSTSRHLATHRPQQSPWGDVMAAAKQREVSHRLNLLTNDRDEVAGILPHHTVVLIAHPLAHKASRPTCGSTPDTAHFCQPHIITTQILRKTTATGLIGVSTYIPETGHQNFKPFTASE